MKSILNFCKTIFLNSILTIFRVQVKDKLFQRRLLSMEWFSNKEQSELSIIIVNGTTNIINDDLNMASRL